MGDPWWNAEASHMRQAVPTRGPSRLGHVSLHPGVSPPGRLVLNRRIRNRTYGPVGGKEPRDSPYPEMTLS